MLFDVATSDPSYDALSQIQFAPAHLGLKIAMACMDGKVYVYECMDVSVLSDWSLEESFDAFALGHARNAGVRCLCWNPSKFDPPQLVCGGEGDENGSALVRVWQLSEATHKWSLVCELDKHIGCGVNGVAWAPNMGRSYHLIASAGQDPSQQLKVHRLARTPERLVPAATQLLPNADQAQGIWRVGWNVTGTVLASSGEEGVVRLWKGSFRGDWTEVRAVASSQFEPTPP